MISTSHGASLLYLLKKICPEEKCIDLKRN